MINFLDVAAPTVEPVSNVNIIVISSILVVLLVAVIIIGLKIREKE